MRASAFEADAVGPASTTVRASGMSGHVRAADDLQTDVYVRIDPDGTLVLPRWLLRELARLIAEEQEHAEGGPASRGARAQ